MHYSGCVVVVLVAVLCQGTQGQHCNMTHAAECIQAMEVTVGRVVESTSGVTKSEPLQKLCLDVIKGNNLTQCYIEATGGCGGQAGGQTPSPIMADWEKVMQDLYQMCDGACPNFLERTINITQCTSLIRFDELYENSYISFCSSLNASLQCSRDVSSDCPVFSQLFYDLLPRGIDETADTICTSGCENLDEAMGRLDTCKTHVANLPEDLDAACSAYGKFRDCLQANEVPFTCPMFGALMDVLYPQHIFGLYEEQCNITDEDRCGSRGIARVDHCLRIFALAWPVSTQTPVLTKEQCGDYQRAQRCLDTSGYQECPSLQQYFTDQTSDRAKHRHILDSSCSRFPDADADHSGSARSASHLRFTESVVASLGVIFLLRCLWV